jgi:solute carrier family 35, member E1
MAPAGLWVAGAHAGSVVALGATAVSFTQIIKASEPIFVAITEIVVHQRWEPWQVYVTLPIIVCGVVLASVKDFSFSFNSLSFASAMFANQCAALKAVRVKDLMSLPWVQDMGPANMYGIIHIISILWILPAAFVTEGPSLRRSYKRCLKKGAPPEHIIHNLLLSGVMFYLYQEMSILCLCKVKPITHSVANTVKRTISLLISCFIFRSPISKESIVGSAMALVGAILYLKALKFYGTYQSIPRFI